MPLGPYAVSCPAVHVTTEDGGEIIHINGTFGDGFSAPGDILARLPDLLEAIARAIRATMLRVH